MLVLNTGAKRISIGPTLDVLKAFGEMERMAGDEEYPDLFLVPQLDEELVTAKMFKRMQEQAKRLMLRSGNAMSDAARMVLDLIVRG